MTLAVEPLTLQNWERFEELFGKNGACGNCWCMAYRMTRKEFILGQKENTHKAAMKQLVREGKPAGLLGFASGEAIAWCAFAPREDFVRMERSRVHKRIDDFPVWSIPCFFIRKDRRRRGVSAGMLKAVTEYAKKNGIRAIEAYPLIPSPVKLPDTFAWCGLLTAFEKAGFTIVDRKSKNRPMVRKYL